MKNALKFTRFNKSSLNYLTPKKYFHSNLKSKFDVIVIGGGHAGCEAASGINLI